MVEFGIQLAAPAADPIVDHHDFYRELLRLGNGHFTTAWVTDHLMKEDHPQLEGWTTLTYLAAEFPAYTFGNLVLGQGYRNPALLAKMAATLDYLTGGRVILGIGAGWQADEYLAYGYPYPSAGTRIEQLGEVIDIVRAMWTQSPASYDGRHYQVREAFCEPRPAAPITILVGGRRPKLMRLVAEKADMWQWDGPIERYHRPYDLLVASCAEAGRDLSTIQLSTFAEAWFPVNPADHQERVPVGFTAAQDPSGAYADEFDWVLGPTPEDAVRQLAPLVELGVTQVTVYFHDSRTLTMFAEHVILALAAGQ
jgi:alkanesulfonate monooxygenase SsuD/methylene tetrahydromethanopterin reductase-like flavin-dependent oxidoreductase (luciferase family)